MGLEAVREEIIRSARKQEEELLAEARGQARKILDEAEKKSWELKEKSDAEAKKLLDLMKKQETASADLEAKKMMLEAKKGIMDKVFEKARQKIEKTEPKKREAFMQSLLEKAKSEIGIGKIYCNKKDAKALKGYKTEHADIICGLIAENEDGTIRVDYSFDTMLQSIEERWLQEINKILFD